MSVPRSVSEVIREHVTLEVECIDRMYLNVYQPRLQSNSVTAIKESSEAQGRRREAASESSVEQTRGPTYRNRIRGVSVGRAGT